MRRAALAAATGLAVALVPGVAQAGGPTPAAAEHFVLVLAGPPGATGTVIASGAVTDTGTVAPEDGDGESFVFPDGTLRLSTSTSTRVQLPRPPACLTRFTSTGTWQVVGGTGRFAGASGSGQSTDSGATVSPVVHGACSEQPTFLMAAGVLAGTIHLSGNGLS